MKKIYCFLMACLALTACSEAEGPEPTTCPLEINTRSMGIIGETNEMSWRLLRQSFKEGENTLLSPFSLSACLAMLDNGAAGDTEAQIRAFLGFEEFSQSEFNEFYKNLLQGLPKVDTSVKLTTANSFWFANGYVPKKSFSAAMHDYYDAETFNVDFAASGSGVLNQINSWCSEKTNKLIPKFLEELNPNTKAMLINAVYFNAMWSTEFKKENTKSESFYLSNGTMKNANFMHRTGDEMGFDGDVVSMVSLPMGKFRKFHVFFALPKEGKTLDEAAIAAQKVLGDQRTNCYPQWRTYEVTMAIPKFKVEINESLNRTLAAMGLEDIFMEKGDFSNMFDDKPVYLSEIRQACYFSINEKEVKAAAVTGGTMVGDAAPAPAPRMQLTLDRPFLYGLYEMSSGTILFLGAMEEPKE